MLSLLCLLHTLVGNSVTGSYPGVTVLHWYKQKQDICDLGCFLPTTRTMEQRTRMMLVEAIVCCSFEDHAAIKVVDYLGTLFSVQIMSNEVVKYTVSIQSNYCDVS